MSPLRTCVGCGGPLPADAHTNRKWCSERCRKASYGDPCVVCGARTVFGAEQARVPEPRCIGCENRRRTAKQMERVVCVIELRAAGLDNAAIARVLGTSHHAIGSLIYEARNLGVAVPLTPYAPVRARVRNGHRGLPSGSREHE